MQGVGDGQVVHGQGVGGQAAADVGGRPQQLGEPGVPPIGPQRGGLTHQGGATGDAGGDHPPDVPGDQAHRRGRTGGGDGRHHPAEQDLAHGPARRRQAAGQHGGVRDETQDGDRGAGLRRQGGRGVREVGGAAGTGAVRAVAPLVQAERGQQLGRHGGHLPAHRGPR